MPKLLPGRTRVSVNLSLSPDTVAALDRAREANLAAIKAAVGRNDTRSSVVEWLATRADPKPPKRAAQ